MSSGRQGSSAHCILTGSRLLPDEAQKYNHTTNADGRNGLIVGRRDSRRVYFLIEPLLGGELFSHLADAGTFTEDRARFYAGSVLLGAWPWPLTNILRKANELL